MLLGYGCKNLLDLDGDGGGFLERIYNDSSILYEMRNCRKLFLAIILLKAMIPRLFQHHLKEKAVMEAVYGFMC